MAGNPVPNPQYELLALVEDMADGFHNHEVAIGLQHNKEADMRGDMTAEAGLGTVPETWTGSVLACNTPVNLAARLGALLRGKTYYWQVNIIGDPPGDLWQFMTGL